MPILGGRMLAGGASAAGGAAGGGGLFGLLSGINPVIGASLLGTGSSLLGGLAGLVGGKSDEEKLSLEQGRFDLGRARQRLGRETDVFNQLGNMFGQDIISPERLGVLFSRGSRSAFGNQARGLSRSIGLSSPLAQFGLASGREGAFAQALSRLIEQGALRDIDIQRLRAGLSRG